MNRITRIIIIQIVKFFRNCFSLEFDCKKPGRTKSKTPTINMTESNLSIKNSYKILLWCGRRDSNSHGLGPHGPQPCLSTNFSTTAVCVIINE